MHVFHAVEKLQQRIIFVIHVNRFFENEDVGVVVLVISDRDGLSQMFHAVSVFLVLELDVAHEKEGLAHVFNVSSNFLVGVLIEYFVDGGIIVEITLVWVDLKLLDHLSLSIN